MYEKLFDKKTTERVARMYPSIIAAGRALNMSRMAFKRLCKFYSVEPPSYRKKKDYATS